VRTSFSAVEDAAPNGKDYDKDFDLESFRFYSGGQLRKGLALEFNAEYETSANGDEDVRVLDAVVKLELSETFNVWAGRMLPPSDRANLSGPYFLNSFDFPFVQQYPNKFAGRDNGIAYWGQVGEGSFKWQGGVFEGNDSDANDGDSLLYAGRLTLNLWEPEAGFYNSSTYYGGKDVFAIGLVAMTQESGASFMQGGVPVEGDFMGWSVDVLLEKKLVPGVLSLEGAYYDYDREGIGTVMNEGAGYFAVASWLFPGHIGSSWLQAQVQPLVRYQRFNAEGSTQLFHASAHERYDVGVNFILDAHNARLSFVFSRDRFDQGLTAGGADWSNIFKVGLQVQI